MRILNLSDLEIAREEISRIGVDKESIEILAPKAMRLCVKLEKVKCGAANILKQEMLSVGGDAAVARGVIDGSVRESDVILLGNLKQIETLSGKIKTQPFGLDKLSLELQRLCAEICQPPNLVWQCRNDQFDLSSRVYIMGILNVTPDSFSDGRCFLEPEKAVAQAHKMIEEGADIIDIGGESFRLKDGGFSTRSGSEPISLDEELQRVIPVIERLKKETKIFISIDTYKSQIAEKALEAGVEIINDISGFHFDSKMPEIVAKYKAGVALMHIKGKPKDMQENPQYDDLIGEIYNDLRDAIEKAKEAGISENQIVIDLGIGFGKTVQDNLMILKRLSEFKGLRRPILVGPSGKSFIGKISDLPMEERLEGTASACAIAMMNGANIIRVHDVKEMKRVAEVAEAIAKLNIKNLPPLAGSR
ncbi:MAG: dihydropteroate synthase [Candidatus Edwardsbacteria bacterium]